MTSQRPPNDEVEGRPPQYLSSRQPLADALLWYRRSLVQMQNDLQKMDIYEDRQAVRKLVFDYGKLLARRREFEEHHHAQRHTLGCTGSKMSCKTAKRQATEREYASRDELLELIQPMYKKEMAWINHQQKRSRKYSITYIRCIAKQHRLEQCMIEFGQLLSH